MELIIFILGFVLGVIVKGFDNILKKSSEEKRKIIAAIHDSLVSPKTQFIDPTPFKEKFEASKTINDLLNG